MKKIEYQRPIIEITVLNIDFLMNVGGSITNSNGDGVDNIDYDGDGTGKDPDAKGFWDDEY